MPPPKGAGGLQRPGSRDSPSYSLRSGSQQSSSPMHGIRDAAQNGSEPTGRKRQYSDSETGRSSQGQYRNGREEEKGRYGRDGPPIKRSPGEWQRGQHDDRDDKQRYPDSRDFSRREHERGSRGYPERSYDRREEGGYGRPSDEIQYANDKRELGRGILDKGSMDRYSGPARDQQMEAGRDQHSDRTRGNIYTDSQEYNREGGRSYLQGSGQLPYRSDDRGNIQKDTYARPESYPSRPPQFPGASTTGYRVGDSQSGRDFTQTYNYGAETRPGRDFRTDPPMGTIDSSRPDAPMYGQSTQGQDQRAQSRYYDERGAGSRPSDAYGSFSSSSAKDPAIEASPRSYPKDRYTQDSQSRYSQTPDQSDQYLTPGSKRELPLRDGYPIRDQEVEGKRGRYSDYSESYGYPSDSGGSRYSRDRADGYRNGSPRGYPLDSSTKPASYASGSYNAGSYASARYGGTDGLASGYRSDGTVPTPDPSRKDMSQPMADQRRGRSSYSDTAYGQDASSYDRPTQPNRDQTYGSSSSSYGYSSSRYGAPSSEERGGLYQPSPYQQQSKQLGQRTETTFVTAPTMSSQATQRPFPGSQGNTADRPPQRASEYADSYYHSGTSAAQSYQASNKMGASQKPAASSQPWQSGGQSRGNVSARSGTYGSRSNEDSGPDAYGAGTGAAKDSYAGYGQAGYGASSAETPSYGGAGYGASQRPYGAPAGPQAAGPSAHARDSYGATTTGTLPPQNRDTKYPYGARF